MARFMPPAGQLGAVPGPLRPAGVGEKTAGDMRSNQVVEVGTAPHGHPMPPFGESSEP